MSLTNNIFTKRFPHLDLHQEYSTTADLIIKEFIKDNLKIGNEIIVFVHGKGEGILKNKVHEILKKDFNVLEYYLDPNNLGTTIVKLKIDK